MGIERAVEWYDPSLGAEPDALVAPRRSWTRYQTGGSLVTTLTDTELSLAVTSAAGAGGFFGLALSPTDRGRRTRERDTLTVQAYVTVAAYTSGSLGDVSPVVLWLRDGSLSVGLAIGSNLDIVTDASSPTLLAARYRLRSSWGYQERHHYRLRKEGTSTLVVEVDGEEIGRVGLAYLAEQATEIGWPGADTTANYRASVYFGHVEFVNATSTSSWADLEVGLNAELAPPWKRERFEAVLPTAMREAWSDTWRAASRALLGAAEDAQAALHRASQARSPGGARAWSHVLPGDQLPTVRTPNTSPWTTTGPVSVVRARIRMGGTSTFARVQVPTETAPSASRVYAVQRLSATWTFRTAVADGSGVVAAMRLGAWSVALVTSAYTGSVVGFEWVLTKLSDPAGMPVPTTSLPNDGPNHYGYPVNPYRSHTVELWRLVSDVAADERYLLVIDGRPVDYVLGDEAGAGSGSGRQGFFAPATTTLFDLENVRYEEHDLDAGRRPLYLQSLGLRLIAVSGSERPDELAVWGWRRFGVQAGRGTIHGITAELQRLGQRGLTYVRQCDWETAGAWFLEVTWPELTPVYLDSDGTGDLVWHMGDYDHTFRNAIVQAWGDYLARYVLPMSVSGDRWLACYFAQCGPVARSAGVLTLDFSVTLGSEYYTEGFHVGDIVWIGNDGETFLVPTVVLSVVSRTRLTVRDAYPTSIPNQIRRIIATS